MGRSTADTGRLGNEAAPSSEKAGRGGVTSDSSVACGEGRRRGCRAMTGRADPEAHSNLVLTIGHSTRTFEEPSPSAQRLPPGRCAPLPPLPASPAIRRGDALRAATPRGRDKLPTPAGPGGRRRPLPDLPNVGWRNLSFRGYADHMRTPEFRADFERLVGLCEGEERVCLMCSEAVWWRCHRRMIADALVVRGFSVKHVLGERRATLHTLTLWAEVVGGTGLHYAPDR
jgi:Domain of unknown function DUF488